MANFIPQYGSLYRRLSGLWAPYYHNRETQLGTTATLVNFGDQEAFGKVNAATGTGIRFNASGLAPTWTPSEALSLWDTPFDLTDPPNWQGCAPILQFNGTDERMTTPDAGYWTRLDTTEAGQNSESLSLGMWIRFALSANIQHIFSKWDATGAAELREWIFLIRDTEVFQFITEDESANVAVNRQEDAASASDTWHQVIFTYDGAIAGATAMNNVTLYVDGVSKASTATNNASYLGMENLATIVSLGASISGGAGTAFFEGELAGGPFGPFFIQAALTAAQVANLYRIERKGLGV